jgi:uncharacterized membrane protein HdeD (DUF308 family)
VFSILAGGFLLVNPELTLGVLVFVVCAWLLIAGVIAVVIALKLRGAGQGSQTHRAQRHRHPRFEAGR